MDHALSPEALEAIKALVRLVLQRERRPDRWDSGAPDLGPGWRGLPMRLAALPQQALLATIRRHRLEGLLHGDPLVARLLPELAPAIRSLARRDTMAALALASLTSTMAALFAQAGLPLLVIKGIPLALQTTGSPTARGRGDLDLVVPPRQLLEAVALLEAQGFRRVPGEIPRHLTSLWGRYSRWAAYELSLVRDNPGGRQWIDLHWALSNVRGPLPGFEQAWRCGERLDLHGQEVVTLSRLHALQHACAHAAKDQWMSLRHLIDIDRLAASLQAEELEGRCSLAVMRWSFWATGSVTQSQAMARCAASPPRVRERLAVLERAKRSQLLPLGVWRRAQAQRWSPGEHAAKVWWSWKAAHGLQDRVRLLVGHLLLPSDFSDPATGRDRGLAAALAARASRLIRQLRT